MFYSFIDGRLAIDWNLPYELRAFETALAEGVRSLDCQVECLEETTFPALEALATKVIINMHASFALIDLIHTNTMAQGFLVNR